MWRAIRRFGFRRDRGAGQVPHGIVEKDGPGDQPNNSDDAVQSAGQDLEEPSGPPVRGTVKWFSPIKGYGFVVLSDGSGDVFLHASALAGVGITNLQPGEALEGIVTVTGGVQRVGQVEPSFTLRQPRLATGWLLRL
jgi:cold shock CspA family protein